MIGICYVNFSASPRRLCSRYAGPRDNGERLPKYVIAPDGKVLYELTEEMVREEFRKRHMKREVFFKTHTLKPSVDEDGFYDEDDF